MNWFTTQDNRMDLNSTIASPSPHVDTDDTYILRYPGLRITVIICIMIIIAATVFGNTLTLAAIIKFRILRTTRNIGNLLVLSLAISDLMVAVGVMPLSLVKTISKESTFGHPLCDIWVSLDVLCCTASILNLCVISLDRYWSIKYPFTYKKRRTTRSMLLMIGTVWFMSTTISLAPLFGWKTEEEKVSSTCQVSQDKVYTIFSTFGAFFIPMTVMLVLYWLIFVEARNRIRGTSFNKYDNNAAQALHEGTVNGEVSHASESCSSMAVNSLRVPNTVECCQHNTLLPNLQGLRNTASNPNLNLDGKSPKPPKSRSMLSLPSTRSPQIALHRLQAQKQAIANIREQKAAKTLAIVTGVFLICWLPFFCLALLTPFCPHCHIPPWLGSLVLWLGYFNSMLNPPIYTKFNPEFQKAFQKTLKCSQYNIANMKG